MKGKKTGGRVAGTPNRITKAVKDVILDLVTEYQSSGLMHSDFFAIEAKDRLYVLKELLPYVLPKQQAVSVTGAEDQTITIEQRLIELSTMPESTKDV